LLWSRFSQPDPRSVELESGQVAFGDQALQRITPGACFNVTGEKPAVLLLADGSRVELAPSSQACIKNRLGEPRQVVELTRGSGLFRVAPGPQAFRVETRAGTVTALGTVFVVKLHPPRHLPQKETEGLPDLDVEVREGKVQVDAGVRSKVLSAGQSMVFFGERGRLGGDDGQQNNRNDGEQKN
jgi:ferric-dicitrate binding protein FerR (iron transport regulator)